MSWTQFRSLIYLDDPLKRDFYAEMCRIERWNTRTLQKKIGGMLFERTALSRKPEQLAREELMRLRDEDRLTPDLVFRDPYVLDFLQLQDSYSEKDLEAAILREIELLQLDRSGIRVATYLTELPPRRLLSNTFFFYVVSQSIRIANRARSWIERGEIDRAVKDCRRMTELDPDYKAGRETVVMVETLGRLQSERGGTLLERAHEHGLLGLLRRYDRPRMPGETLQVAMRQPAVSIANEQAPQNPGRTPSEWNHEGVLAGRRGDYQTALEAFTKAIEADPRFADSVVQSRQDFQAFEPGKRGHSGLSRGRPSRSGQR